MVAFSLHQGIAPLLVSLPHDGTELPAGFAERLTATARALPDTDWHVGRLYEFARRMGASILRPRYSRYVVDLNRPPDDVSLYPGQNTTGLCPIVRFDGGAVYRAGAEPTPAEIEQRVAQYWQPYHAALQAELQRLRQSHGRVVLWEGHSIRSVLPFLFPGRLPDLNLGTASGASCRAELQRRLVRDLQAAVAFTHAVNGRFKGGYITRHYGEPARGIDAVQLELAQCNYMDEATTAFDEGKARVVQGLLRRLFETCLATDEA